MLAWGWSRNGPKHVAVLGYWWLYILCFNRINQLILHWNVVFQFVFNPYPANVEKMGWASNNARKWQMGFNSPFKGLSVHFFGFCNQYHIDSSWNVLAHGDAREEKWRGNWRMVWVVSTFHTTSGHGVSSITTADAHTSAASRLNWRPRRFK